MVENSDFKLNKNKNNVPCFDFCNETCIMSKYKKRFLSPPLPHCLELPKMGCVLVLI